MPSRNLVKIDRLREIINSTYQELNRKTNGSLGILVLAARRFVRAGASEAAASLAYYAFFSLFPLLLVLISAGSYALDSKVISDQIFKLLSGIIPGSSGFIQNAVQQVLEQRGPVGILGALGLVWSASGAFSGLIKHINSAWPGADRRGMFRRRFVGIGLVGSLLLLFSAWIASNLLLGIMPRFLSPEALSQSTFGSKTLAIGVQLIPFLFTLLMFFGLYRWIPTREVTFRAAVLGALAASLGSEITTNAFSWYIASGFAGYALVYGSLGAVVAFLFWIYLLGQITLFGAHLSAAIQYGSRGK